MNTTPLATELIRGSKDFDDMQGIVPRVHCVRVLVLLVLDVPHAIIELFCGIQVAGILMVDNPPEDFAELSPVQLCRFSIPLNESALKGNEFIHEHVA